MPILRMVLILIARINSMVGSLKCTYPGLTSDAMATIMDQIQCSIRQKVSYRLSNIYV